MAAPSMTLEEHRVLARHAVRVRLAKQDSAEQRGGHGADDDRLTSVSHVDTFDDSCRTTY